MLSQMRGEGKRKVDGLRKPVPNWDLLQPPSRKVHEGGRPPELPHSSQQTNGLSGPPTYQQGRAGNASGRSLLHYKGHIQGLNPGVPAVGSCGACAIDGNGVGSGRSSRVVDGFRQDR